jgi:hypothetical protein
MKRNKFFLLPLALLLIVASCKKAAFVDANINPSVVNSVDPGQEFLYGSLHFPNDFEYYYDVYQCMMPWMQFSTGKLGNSQSFDLQTGANFNYRYGNFYGNVGLNLSDIPHQIKNLPATEQPTRVYENAIASIAKAYYAFYVSDIDGDIPYSEAFLARYGGTLTPAYDVQANLFDTLDLEVKTAVATLEASQATTQVLYGSTYDPFYGNSAGSESTHWIKAGNALRLKMAMRLLKRNASGVAAIVQDVLSDANQMSSNGDGWVLMVGPSFATESSNYNANGYLASQPVVNYMLATGDPRLPIYYRPDSNGVYYGSPTNPDTCALPAYQTLYKANAFSGVQHRLFTPNFDEGDGAGPGTGNGFFPFLTYAEYCYIRADLAARSVTSDNPATWYNAGVGASINFYDSMAQQVGINGYTPVTPTQITNYLAQPAVAYSSAIGTQQIACQAYLDFYRQPNEAWAWWKRTGYPNTTTPLAWSTLTEGGAPVTISRRTSLSSLTAADPNYANQQAAFTQMASDANWGQGPTDGKGRVWWDMP